MTRRASCTIHALAACLGITFERAEQIATYAGKRPGVRIASSKMIAAAKRLGFSFRKLRMKQRTLSRFLREHPSGRFYVRKRGHAFAVVSGVVIDNRLVSKLTAHTRVVDAWEFIFEGPQS